MHSNSSNLSTSIELAWSKLNKYYTLTDVNPILYTSVVLHPSMKYDYFNIKWRDRPSWISHARTCVTSLWMDVYRSRAASPSPPSTAAVPAPPRPVIQALTAGNCSARLPAPRNEM